MFKNAFWTYITRLVILVLAAVSAEVDYFWLRFSLLFVAFALFELNDFFVSKKDNDGTPPIARI